MQNKLNEQNPPVFILGVQRSGTTLLRLILNSHSDIAIPEEAAFLRPIIKKKYIYNEISGKDLKRIYSYLKNSPHYALWNYDSSKFLNWLKKQHSISLKEFINNLFMSYAESEGKIRWGDKTPSLFRKVDLLYQLFPEAKFIHIVRDGRDVFDSRRRMDSTKDNAAVMAIEWRYKIYKIERFLELLPPSNKYTLRYEDLLINPEETLKNLCGFMQVEYEPQMRDFYRKSKYYVGSHHSKLIFKPITSENLQKWKKKLSEKEIKVFNLLANRYLKKYGYEVDNVKLSFKDVIFLFSKILIGFHYRLYTVFKANMLFKKSLKGKRVIFKHGKQAESKEEKLS
ncbi:MAG: hypothetical protein A2W05_08050 [Candidatus Schekmanbacteria bacterium RBG_16_38_10]|uniref:Sulfotransferase n=1 Tax=Candidatus Schekmanbacteria bacterium RBG_16_38_10 TaxID=1817879 RepID=A0A1F7RRI3_9BACT|nr:MAG: hypothetical protein A2W05_08050 [Candidatus Schekmanbacteria bacterium RBG_16_38_10]